MGECRMYFRTHGPEVYDDFESHEEAFRAIAEIGLDRAEPVRLVENGNVVLEGEDLIEKVRLRQKAMEVYEAVRLSPKRQELGVGLEWHQWDKNEAKYAFSGYGPTQPRRVTEEALRTHSVEEIANELLNEVRMEMAYRRGKWGHPGK